MKTKQFIMSVIGVIFFCVVNQAGAISVFDNKSDYLSATGSELFSIDFNGDTTGYMPGDSFGPHITFGSPEALPQFSDMVFRLSGAITDSGSTTASNGVGPLSGEFTNPVFAFGLVFSDATKNETIKLYDETNSLISSITTLFPQSFFGVISDTAIKSFQIYGAMSDGARDRFFIDDFRADAVVPIPEPATFLLFGSGLAGIIGFKKINIVSRQA